MRPCCPLVGPQTTETSASGIYIARYRVEGDVFRPEIVSKQGQREWTDERRHSLRFGAGVFWDPDVDVLWILSRDLGNASVRRVEGSWQFECPTTLPHPLPDLTEAP